MSLQEHTVSLSAARVEYWLIVRMYSLTKAQLGSILMHNLLCNEKLALSAVLRIVMGWTLVLTLCSLLGVTWHWYVVQACCAKCPPPQESESMLLYVHSDLHYILWLLQVIAISIISFAVMQRIVFVLLYFSYFIYFYSIIVKHANISHVQYIVLFRHMDVFFHTRC
jgi:hypothetical protein